MLVARANRFALFFAICLQVQNLFCIFTSTLKQNKMTNDNTLLTLKRKVATEYPLTGVSDTEKANALTILINLPVEHTPNGYLVTALKNASEADAKQLQSYTTIARIKYDSDRQTAYAIFEDIYNVLDFGYLVNGLLDAPAF